jgi:hypothetical protein
MANLYVLRIAGDADDIAARVAGVSEEAWAIIADHGFVGETLGRTPDGVVVAEVWESDQGFRDALAHPVVAAEFERVQMPPVELEGPYEIVRDFHPGR